MTNAAKTCAHRLQELLAWPVGQRWARQFMDGGEPSYPHQQGDLTAQRLEAHTAGEITLGLVPDGHGGMAKYGAIDLDQPRDGETLLDLLTLLASLQSAAAERGLQTFGSFSGRRGFHLVMPVALPMAWGVVHRCLRRVARDVGFEPAELFPARGKALKLPCGLHQAGAWSVVLPSLIGASEAGLDALAGDLELALAAATAGAPLEPLWEDQAALLMSIKASDPDAVESAAGQSTVPDLGALPEDAHPACIAALLEQGPRPESTINGENLNLARYCAQRGLDEDQAVAMATQLWKAAPEGYTRKDLGASLRNFQQSFRKAQEGDSTYLFRCSDLVAGGPAEARKLVASGRCKGEKCQAWPWGLETSLNVSGRPKQELRDRKGPFPTSYETGGIGNSADVFGSGERHGRRLWRALQVCHAQGQELRPSLVLAAAETLTDDTHPSREPQHVSKADQLAEKEFLATVLAGPHGEAVLKTALTLSPAAFNAITEAPWEDWVEGLSEAAAVPEDTWRVHLERLAETALRVEAEALGQALASNSHSKLIGPVDALATAAQGLAQLQRAATPDLTPVDDHLEALVGELLNTAPPRIPVVHPGLVKVTGGGFRQGQLIAAGGPPGSGKTTWALQVADEAAAAGVPVIFLSMEMTRSQLMQASLSRLSGLDGRTIAAGIKTNSLEARQLLQVLPTYREIAQRLYIVEGGPQHTPGRLQALIGQVRHQQNLPPDAPLLVVVDYLQLMALGIEGEAAMAEPLRVGQLATAMKVLARNTAASVLVLSDVTKQAMAEAEAGNRIGPGVFKESARVLHACDLALVVQSGTIPAQKGKPAQNLLELALTEVGLSDDRRRVLEGALRDLPHPGDTYGRLTVIKNRGGQNGGEVWSLYRRHLSQYLAVLPGEADPEALPNSEWSNAF